MARIAPDPYSFLIENVAKLPVIASQDQEFWLAAAISCIEAVPEPTADEDPSRKGSEISATSLLTVFECCIGAYEKLVSSQLPESKIPSWSQLLIEALEARERIFQFRLSKLFRCLNGPYHEDNDKRLATKVVTEIAQCLSVFPLEFLRFWRTYLENHGRNPSVQAAAPFLLDTDWVDLRASIEAGAAKARGILIEGYLRYSLRMVLAYINMGVEYADLVQEAALGLVLAAEKYNYLEHGRFALFATVWMWQRITRSVANDSRLIRLPVHAAQQRQDIQKQLGQHVKEFGDSGSLISLIKSKEGLNVKKSMSLLTVGVLPVRLDCPAPGLSRRDLEVLVTTSTNSVSHVDTYDGADFVAALLRELSEKERDVVSRRFGLCEFQEEHTLDEIGCHYNLTRERIRQVEEKALGKLSRALKRMPITSGRECFTMRIPRGLDAISLDEALTPAHPYMPEDRQKLDERLTNLFGRRQSSVRQGLTIKGRILAVFDLYGTPLNTREINDGLGILYPLDAHLETTLYSVMAGNADAFVSLGGGVFGLTTAEDSLITDREEAAVAPVREPQTEGVLIAQPDAVLDSVLKGWEPESLAFPLQVMRTIFERSADLREELSWSLAELAWTPEDRAKLSRWAQIGKVELQALRSQRITHLGTTFSGMDCLSITFLALCSYVAQRNAVEGDMWSNVNDSLGSQLRRILFSGPGSPRRFLRDATEDICRKLRIRHAFGREGEQSWFRTVFLQFGLSRRGFNRLPFWLGQGALPPVAVQDLTSKGSKLYSETFSSLWMVFQRCRWGH